MWKTQSQHALKDRKQGNIRYHHHQKTHNTQNKRKTNTKNTGKNTDYVSVLLEREAISGVPSALLSGSASIPSPVSNNRLSGIC